jgi:hypothetical protein
MPSTAATQSTNSDNSTLTNNSSSGATTTAAESSHVVKPTPLPSTNHAIVNSEEFAKLDALLEDLLAEVDQPIFLNKTLKQQQAKAKNFKTQLTANVNGGSPSTGNGYHSHQVDDVERSVDWLSEQKELLKARKETTAVNTPPYRSIKSKLDYYLNNNMSDRSNGMSSNSAAKFGFSYTTPDSFDKINGGNASYHQNHSNSSFNPIEDSLLMDQSDDFRNNASSLTVKPPTSPKTVRASQQPLTAVNTHVQFRSLSTNPNLLVRFIHYLNFFNLESKSCYEKSLLDNFLVL